MKNGKSEIGFPIIRDESEVPGFYCIECQKSCSGTPYSFGGGFACEACVRAYYRNLPPVDIAEELRFRGRSALGAMRKRRIGRRND